MCAYSDGPRVGDNLIRGGSYSVKRGCRMATAKHDRDEQEGDDEDDEDDEEGEGGEEEVVTRRNRNCIEPPDKPVAGTVCSTEGAWSMFVADTVGVGSAGLPRTSTHQPVRLSREFVESEASRDEGSAEAGPSNRDQLPGLLGEPICRFEEEDEEKEEDDEEEAEEVVSPAEQLVSRAYWSWQLGQLGKLEQRKPRQDRGSVLSDPINCWPNDIQ
ncbi:unnamed protein product, partial [Protopolystoma xenopodis]